MSNQIAIQEFKFQSSSLRVIPDENGEPWFIAKDVCDILGYKNVSQAIDDNCRKSGISKRYIPILSANYTLIDEGNLYRLVIKSNKPEAEPFESYVCDEVLPTLRKTGSYSVNNINLSPKKVASSLNDNLLYQQYLESSLKLSDTSVMRNLRIIESNFDLLPLLPDYTNTDIEKPAILSLSQLLKNHGSKLSAIKANKILLDIGFLESIERNSRSSKTGKSSFKQITDEGLKYGKNETSDENPRETQPLWYVNKFSELLSLIEEHELVGV